MVRTVVIVCEPQIAVRPRGNAECSGTCDRQRVFGQCSCGGDGADSARAVFSEPKSAVRSRSDRVRPASARKWKLCNRTRGGDPSDLVAEPLRKPQIAVRPGHNPAWIAPVCRQIEFRDRPVGIDLQDLPRESSKAPGLRDPKVAIR